PPSSRRPFSVLQADRPVPRGGLPVRRQTPCGRLPAAAAPCRAYAPTGKVPQRGSPVRHVGRPDPFARNCRKGGLLKVPRCARQILAAADASGATPPAFALSWRAGFAAPERSPPAPRVPESSARPTHLKNR